MNLVDCVEWCVFDSLFYGLLLSGLQDEYNIDFFPTGPGTRNLDFQALYLYRLNHFW